MNSTHHNSQHNTPLPDPKALAQHFLRSLQQDKTDLAALENCLTEERSVLESSDHNRLPTYTEQKAKLTQQLEQRYTERLKTLQPGMTPANSEGWRKLLQQLQDDSKLPLVALWDEVEKQLKDCQKLLLINEKIVAGLQNNVSQLMNALRGATGSGQTYSAKGKAQIFSDNQSITSA